MAKRIKPKFSKKELLTKRILIRNNKLFCYTDSIRLYLKQKNENNDDGN